MEYIGKTALSIPSASFLTLAPSLFPSLSPHSLPSCPLISLSLSSSMPRARFLAPSLSPPPSSLSPRPSSSSSLSYSYHLSALVGDTGRGRVVVICGILKVSWKVFQASILTLSPYRINGGLLRFVNLL